MRFLLFLICSIAFGSQSIQLSNTSRAVSSGATLSGPWLTLSSYRLEAHVWNYVAQPGVVVGVWEAESNMQVVINASNVLVCVGPSQITQVALALNTTTAFRFRCRRDTASALYTVELWDEITGEYRSNTVVDPTPATTFNIGASRISIGSFFEANGINTAIGMFRAYTSPGALGATIPPWHITTNYGNMLDFEFNGNLTDNSPLAMNVSVSAGSVSYPTTTNRAPAVSLANVPTKSRASFSVSLPIIGFANNDNTALTYSIVQSAGPQQVTFAGGTTATPSYIPPVFGQYDLVETITDTASLSTSTAFSVGAVATDSNGTVIIPDANINKIFGAMTLNNPWPWYDNRAEAAALIQINLQTASGSSVIAPWLDIWNTANAHGRIQVIYLDTVVIGTSTQFQVDFCGGHGNTTPSPLTSSIAIWYPSSDYPGTFSRGFYKVTECTSETQLTLDHAFAHEHGTLPNLQYSTLNPFEPTPSPLVPQGLGGWTYIPIPGNYYDSVLALYGLWFRTGLTKYRDAARALARAWWEGPNWSRGRVYNNADPGIAGNFIIAGPGRGQSATGLILWALESGEDIWPGIRYYWGYIRANLNTVIAAMPNAQIGDLRETGYETAFLGMCATYDPDTTPTTGWRALCLSTLQASMDQVWTPLQVTPTSTQGNWRNTQVGNPPPFMQSDGMLFVSTINGSPTITLHGFTWAFSNFQNPNHPTPNQTSFLWFTNSPNYPEPPGNNNAAVGDSTFYCADYVDATHASLTDCNGNPRNYAGTTGNHGMQSSAITAFGTQPFMQGIVGGQFASFVRDALLLAGDTTRAAVALQFAVDSVNWLINNGGTDAVNHTIWGAAEFLNCIPPTADASCASGPTLNGEVMKNYSTVYSLTRSEAVRTAGDALFGRMFCKPGYTCPVPGYGDYLDVMDDGGTDMNPNDPHSNKWFGYFFGYGGAYQWASVRAGGLLPVDPLTLSTSGFMRTGSAKIRLTVQAPDGTVTIVTCAGTAGTPQSCSWTGDRRQGNYQLKTEYLTSGDALIGPSTFQSIQVAGGA